MSVTVLQSITAHSNENNNNVNTFSSQGKRVTNNCAPMTLEFDVFPSDPSLFQQNACVHADASNLACVLCVLCSFLCFEAGSRGSGVTAIEIESHFNWWRRCRRVGHLQV